MTGGEDFSDCDSPQGKGPSPSGAFSSFSPMSQCYNGSQECPKPGSSVFTFPPSSFVNGSSSSSSDHSPARSKSYSRSMEDRIMPLCIAARPLRKRELLRLLSSITPSAEVFESDQVIIVVINGYRQCSLKMSFLHHRCICWMTGRTCGCSSVEAFLKRYATCSFTPTCSRQIHRLCDTTQE